MRLQELCESQGLFGDDKLVILQDTLNELHKYHQAEGYLEATLEKVPANVVLVFAEKQPPDKRLRFFKKLQKLAKVKEFSIPIGKILESWIKNKLQDRGFQIEKAALERLVSLLGEDYTLWQISEELEKLRLFFPQDKVITEDQVRQIVSPNITQNVFELTNLVAEGQIVLAVSLLEQMVKGGAVAEIKTQIIQIVGALASQIRSLLLVKDLENVPADETAKILGWKPGRVWINLKLSKKFTSARLKHLLQDLKAIDYRLKTSEEPAKLLLTLFFQKIATPSFLLPLAPPAPLSGACRTGREGGD